MPSPLSFLKGMLHPPRCAASVQVLVVGLLLSTLAAAQAPVGEAGAAAATGRGGIHFVCPQRHPQALLQELVTYLQSEGVPPELYRTEIDAAHGSVRLQLRDTRNTSNTLNLIQRPEFELREAFVTLPAPGGRSRMVLTVSRQEILVALLQKGRETRFEGKACELQALIDEVGLRQNTVAWTESVTWTWPNGGPARWNKRYWDRGNLRSRKQLHAAVMDAFLHPERYSIGCYTATKLVVVQAHLDYFKRVRPDTQKRKAVEAALLRDGDPLSSIEPGAMWYFEEDATAQDLQRGGKLLRLMDAVDTTNFVPGDWAYFLNTDTVSYAKTGYEGSNAIYLGRGKFDDYYNDNNHAYTYAEKLQEVYQWRNGVFSRSHDLAKMHLLTAREIQALGETPARGGLQLPYRAIPLRHGYE